jgi:hypothetical protein
MKLAPAKVGADRKRIVILGALVIILGVVFWINRTPSIPDGATTSTSQQTSAIPPIANPAGGAAALSTTPRVPIPAQRTSPGQRGGLGGNQNSIEDFRPTLKLPEGADVSRIDPTLKLDLLTKLQNVPMEGGARSLFEFAQAPPPKPPPPVNPIKPGPVVAAETPPPAPPAAPVKPPPPPIPLKFYGYVNNNSQGGKRRAFFLDGDDIFVAGEDEMIRNRYKIVRIGVNSAVVEDTTNSNQQTLPLIEELAG